MILIDDCKTVAEKGLDYVNDELSTDEHNAVGQHLRSCSKCRQKFSAFNRVESLLQGAIGPSALSPEFDRRTEERLIATTSSLQALEHEDEELEAPPPSFLESLQSHLGTAPWWLISGAFHALVLLLVTLISMAILRGDTKDVVIVTDLQTREKPEEIEEIKQRDIFKKPVPIENVEIETDQTPIVTHEEVEIAEVVETDNDSDAQDTRGEDGLSDVWLGGSGTVAALGLGGGGGGAFGRPGGAGGRLRRAIRGGGGKATESAVDAALAWLARHQEADGRWDCDKYCEDNPWKTKYSQHLDTGVTGLALLAFLGAGHTSKTGRYKANVRKALDWVVSVQGADGCYGPKKPTFIWSYMYGQAICTLAMAEASAMCRDARYKASAQKGIDYILAARGKHGVWSYKFQPPKRFDASVTGWMGMALKSAKIAGLNVPPESFMGIRKWMGSDKMEEAYQDPTVVYANAKPMEGRKGPAMTAIAMLMAMYTGTNGAAPPMQKGASELLKVLPSWEANASSKGIPPIAAAYTHKGFNNEYTWYYGTLVMFQVGGPAWKQWNASLKGALVPSQCNGGPRDGSPQDTDGSWDPVNGWCAKVGGRAYMTAICALSLEVYYRYLPLYRE